MGLFIGTDPRSREPYLINLNRSATESDLPFVRALVPFAALLVLRLRMNPRVGLVGDFRQDKQIVSAETIRAFPLLLVSVETRERSVEPDTVSRFVSPDCGFD
jgi:hypothetical protein